MLIRKYQSNWRSSAKLQAQDALLAALDTLDPIAINRESLESYVQWTAHEIEQVTKILGDSAHV